MICKNTVNLLEQRGCSKHAMHLWGVWWFTLASAYTNTKSLDPASEIIYWALAAYEALTIVGLVVSKAIAKAYQKSCIVWCSQWTVGASWNLFYVFLYCRMWSCIPPFTRKISLTICGALQLCFRCNNATVIQHMATLKISLKILPLNPKLAKNKSNLN